LDHGGTIMPASIVCKQRRAAVRPAAARGSKSARRGAIRRQGRAHGNFSCAMSKRGRAVRPCCKPEKRKPPRLAPGTAAATAQRRCNPRQNMSPHVQQTQEIEAHNPADPDHRCRSHARHARSRASTRPECRDAKARVPGARSAAGLPSTACAAVSSRMATENRR